jgi:signal recognition particle receptor subunit alpha
VTVKRKQKGKVLRKWGDELPSESEMASLDFSYQKLGDLDDRPASNDLQALVDEASLGSRTKDGLYEVKDWEFANGGTADDVIAKALSGNLDKESKPAPQSSLGTLGSLFARFTGTKILSEDDLKPVLEGMKQHLMKKNVAKNIAEKVCEGVGQNLVGKKVGGFQSTSGAHSTQRDDSRGFHLIATSAAVRQALSNSITHILTPKTSTDLLLSIRAKLSSPLTSTQQRIPYSITFVGVNGVGKSTNLSKVCFWLIQNGFRVLIAACDTFRCVFFDTHSGHQASNARVGAVLWNSYACTSGI